MDSIEAALADLRLQDKPNFTATAKKYGCDRMTLSRRFHRVTTSKAEGYDSLRLLNSTQSKALIKYINDLTEHSLPLTISIFQNLASGITGREAGDC